VRALVPRCNGGRLNRVDATRNVAGQTICEGDDRRGIAGQDVPTIAGGRIGMRRISHER
jgi:hypothetical protein